jgi:hypothetical protein
VCRWVESFVSGDSVTIKVNDDIRTYIHTRKVLRKGDFRSPIFFNVVLNMLAILVERVKEVGQKIGGVIPHLVEVGLSIL